MEFQIVSKMISSFGTQPNDFNIRMENYMRIAKIIFIRKSKGGGIGIQFTIENNQENTEIYKLKSIQMIEK